MNEIEKEIDNLGRVVIPKDFRKKLGLNNNDRVFISLKKQSIVITPTENRCVLCGEKMNEKKSIALCDFCIKKVKSIE